MFPQSSSQPQGQSSQPQNYPPLHNASPLPGAQPSMSPASAPIGQRVFTPIDPLAQPVSATPVSRPVSQQTASPYPSSPLEDMWAHTDAQPAMPSSSPLNPWNTTAQPVPPLTPASSSLQSAQASAPQPSPFQFDPSHDLGAPYAASASSLPHTDSMPTQLSTASSFNPYAPQPAPPTLDPLMGLGERGQQFTPPNTQAQGFAQPIPPSTPPAFPQSTPISSTPAVAPIDIPHTVPSADLFQSSSAPVTPTVAAPVTQPSAPSSSAPTSLFAASAASSVPISQQPSTQTIHQSILSEIEQEELFGRERLSTWQKVLIVTVACVTLAIVAGAGIWVYMTVTAPAVANAPIAGKDSDNDGLSDEQERTFGTLVNNPDTDGDGYLDGEEVKNGYSPLRK